MFYGRKRPRSYFSPITLIPAPGPSLVFYGRKRPRTIFSPITRAQQVWAKSTTTCVFAHTSLFSAGFWAYVLWAKSTPNLLFAHTPLSDSMGEIDPESDFRPYFSFQRRILGLCFMGENNPEPAFRPYSALRQYGRNRPQHVFSPITLVPVPGPRLMLYGRNQLPTFYRPYSRKLALTSGSHKKVAVAS